MNTKKILCLIPARGGSKRIPRKNLKLLLGKPLVWWTMKAAEDSGVFDKIILSSDDDEVLKEAFNFKSVTSLKRPLEFAQDLSSGMDPIFHALEKFPGYDYIVLMQPTSPLRGAQVTSEFVKKLLTGLDFLVSVRESKEIPTHLFFVQSEKLVPVVSDPQLQQARSQDVPKTVTLNGALYGASVPEMLKTRDFMTASTEYYLMADDLSVDIDTEEDFFKAEKILKEKNDNSRLV